jgi:two-component system sensor histidine kinase TctE
VTAAAVPARSLTRRLLWALVGSLTIVAVVLGAGGYWVIHGVAESSADRLLGASARAIAETLAVEDGEITLDLPPFALGMLENNSRDNVYYSVRLDQKLITGYPDLPVAPPALINVEESSFRYAQFRGARIRIAAEARRLPRLPGVIIVQVAETLDARNDLSRQMLAGLATLEAALVGIAALLVWPAVKWSLRPVTKLRAKMDARTEARADFTPLPVTGVPVELSALVVGFNGLLGRLETSVEGMRRFTADASHQMRTPLTILRTHLAILRKHGTGVAAGRDSLTDIEAATIRLQGLLTGLITLARAEDAAVSHVKSKIDLRSVARKVAKSYAAVGASAGVEVHLEHDSAPVRVAADPLLVEELLGNLLDNAIRYNRRGGSVTVSARTDPAGARLQVTDDGPGIPPEDRGKVLQRFFRLPRDQTREGSGLGLSIVQAIASRLHATLDIASGPAERGLQVTLTFAEGTVLVADDDHD